MNLNFTKMHGAGNDFIIVDNTKEHFRVTGDIINKMCDRRRSVGADGLIALKRSKNQDSGYNVIMEYYNSDGSRGEMCGNGLRCAAYYSNKIMNLAEKLKVKTDAGILEAAVLGKNSVKISIPVICDFEEVIIDGQNMYYGNTGVPHVVVCVDDLDNCNVFEKGRYLRNHKRFPKGANVNFIRIGNYDEIVKIRTYERGVESETSACGTGISASAISLKKFKGYPGRILFETRDKDVLEVNVFEKNNCMKIYLTGPAEIAFHGSF
jgi:diaminopimelate epimerase